MPCDRDPRLEIPPREIPVGVVSAADRGPAQRAPRVLYDPFHLGLSVYRFIGVLQQESGKGPRFANGAAYCVPDLTSHALPPWRALLGRPDPLGSRLPHLSAGKSGVGGERVV